jgi:predicted PurR-regulated permease PerM
VFGPLVAAVAIVLVALFSGFSHVLSLVVFVALYRMFQDYVLAPYLMSEAVHVPMIAVVFGLLAGEELAGAAGIFLSVPVIAALRIITIRLWAATHPADRPDQ